MKKLLFVLVCAFIACGGCAGNQLTAQDETNLAEFQAKDAACIAAHQPDKAAVDACRADAKAAFEAAEKDAGLE